MPSYYLIEQQHLSPPRPEGHGIPANSKRIGFLDFLRELEQEDFALTPYEGLLVEGIEDVLLASRPDMDSMAHNIRHLLQKSASCLQDELVANVQIVFRNKIVRGEEIDELCFGQTGGQQGFVCLSLWSAARVEIVRLEGGLVKSEMQVGLGVCCKVAKIGSMQAGVYLAIWN